MGLAVDAGGNAFVTGSTTSQDFPTTTGAFRTTPGTSYVTKLNPAGTALVYSTYFPGAIAQSIALDAAGNAHITGMTTTTDSDPPTLPVVNAYQPTLGGQFTFDAFAAKLNPEGTALVFSTFLGGPAGTGDTPRGGDDYGNGVAVDSAGNVYVSGATRSRCFPAINPYIPRSNCPSGMGFREFLVKFNPAGNTLLFSKMLNNLPADGGGLNVSPAGVSTVAWSCNNLHTSYDVCVERVSATGTTIFSTVFGGNQLDSVSGVTADHATGDVYVVGLTESPDYPTTPGVFKQTSSGLREGFATKLSTTQAEVRFARVAPGSPAAAYNVTEGEGKLTVRVERSGDLTNSFTVDYATIDGTATSTSDYAAAAGTLRFAPFETLKLIDVFITDDVYDEPFESFGVRLSNPTGALLGADNEASVGINDNDAADGQSPVVPPGFDADFFVRQHYIDFLNREPDAAGFQFWKGELSGCGSDAVCLEVKRVNVSAAFFLSIEFQETGYLVYRTYKAAYADATSPGVAGTVPVIRLNEFLPDTRRTGEGIIIGQGDWLGQLNANKDAYLREFVLRSRFIANYPGFMTAAEFVDKLNQNAGGVLSADERAALIAELSPAPGDTALRASVLRKVAEDADLRQREFNRAFVLMEYFGYLRRNPDDAPEPTLNYAGWRFWLSKLEEFGGDHVRAELVKAFINSDEYRRRFGP